MFDGSKDDGDGGDSGPNHNQAREVIRTRLNDPQYCRGVFVSLDHDGTPNIIIAGMDIDDLLLAKMVLERSVNKQFDTEYGTLSERDPRDRKPKGAVIFGNNGDLEQMLDGIAKGEDINSIIDKLRNKNKKGMN